MVIVIVRDEQLVSEFSLRLGSIIGLGDSGTMSMLEETESPNYSSSEDGKSQDLSSTTDIDENYYAAPIDDSTLTTVEELEQAVEHVKSLVLETEAVSVDRQRLVKRLIELRLKLQDVKEVSEELVPSSEELRIVQSHQFLLQHQALHHHLCAQYCDRCGGVIWTVLQSYYKCKGCMYQCHSKCLNQVVRVCQFLKVSVEAQYIPNICPEKGLPSQNYKCAECKGHFTLKNSWMEPRRCDYDGLYYCPVCHKNHSAVIPARILHNWDFEERKICEASKQFLGLMSRKPNIHVEKINPKLFTFVEELNAVRRLRKEIIIMKEYFMTCRDAISQKLLRMLDGRQHFVESSYMYSLQDLIDVQNESLVKFLTGVHASFLKHIKEDCQTCLGKGFICEICENVQVIFPFDSAITCCPKCHTVFHTICFAKRESCPKCLRRANRALKKPQK